MQSTKVVPALSDDGWVDGSIKRADYIMSHFFLSDYSQSYIYQGKVSSLPWIIQQTQADMLETLRLTENTLSNYFNRYFDNVVVEVTEVPHPTDDSIGQIGIYISFTDDTGENTTLSKLVQTTEAKIVKVIDLNNG